MRFKPVFLCAFIFLSSQNVLSCPRECDESFLPAFRAWEETVWGEGAIISSPRDPAVVDKQLRAELVSKESKEKWDAFIKKIQPADTLHFFVTDRKSWGMLLGYEGYAIVRNGEIVEFFGTFMN